MQLPKLLHSGSGSARDRSKPGLWGRRQHIADPPPPGVHCQPAGYAPGAHRNQHQVCYEADALDPHQHTGWSMIATGTAQLVTSPATISHYGRLLEPWDAGQMDHIIAITPQIIGGIRRDGPARRRP